MKIYTPATSANLGPGFDSLGLALSLYNCFEVEKAKEFEITGCPKKYQNEDNLFIVAFKEVVKRANKRIKCKVKITTRIPVARGLGSSASLIVAGAVSANELINHYFTRDEIYEICAEIEGHPDNVAPCFFGGLHMAYKNDKGRFEDYILHLAQNVNFTVIIPDYEVKTEDARAVLPKEVPMTDAVYNIQRSILMVKSLEYGDHGTLRKAGEDKLATKYRKELIKDYDSVLKLVRYNSGSCLLISGSGSTMLAISDSSNFAEKLTPFLPEGLKAMDLAVDTFGARVVHDSDDSINAAAKKKTKKKKTNKTSEKVA